MLGEESGRQGGGVGVGVCGDGVGVGVCDIRVIWKANREASDLHGNAVRLGMTLT